MSDLPRYDVVLMALGTIRSKFRQAPYTRTWTHQQGLLGEALVALAEEKLGAGQELVVVLAQIRQLAGNLQPPDATVVAASLEAIANWLELDWGDGYAD